MPKSTPKPPHLPFDILTLIAHVSIPAYRVLLALPRFGRRSLQSLSAVSFSLIYERYFTICTTTDRTVAEEWMIASQHPRGGPYRHHRHHLDGPACITYHLNGQKATETWYYKGLQHHPSGPAYIFCNSNGQKEEELWYCRGQLHRFDGPACIRYFNDGQKFMEDWYLYGQRHRVDGPATIYADGRMEYFLHDKYYTKEDYEAELLRLTQRHYSQ
jgi:hypothetical protein